MPVTVHPHLAFLALGSNLGEPLAQLRSAFASLNRVAGISVEQRSSIYQSPAWGASSEQPDYFNAVLCVRTSLDPHALWRATSHIETTQGRVRDNHRNAARTLDIDLLLYDDLILATDDLLIPHPRMHERAFVLLPLLEIAPDVTIPGYGRASIALPGVTSHKIHRIESVQSWI